MDTQAEISRLERSLKESEQVQEELDRRVFHLKTLYDVSQDIFGNVESEVILKNFLLMTMGNFGVAEGFVLLSDPESDGCKRFIAMGCADEEAACLRETVAGLCSHAADANWRACDEILARREELPIRLDLSMPFEVAAGTVGILGLGPKLIEEDYTDQDRELIDTLVNNLVVALKNARSFEQIRNLNVELEAKNRQLEQTLTDLKQALRRIEMLETIKSNLSKFVPTTVNRLVEKSPTGDIQEARERDVSVLFLDIEGYTRLTEELGATEVNALTERYFSLFMEAIYENNGDVVETAGDGLMVLFLTEDDRQHALEAVQTARTVIEKAGSINQACRLDALPILINIGICSGQAFVGASRFESIAGDRWTYTSHGTPTNVAARLCGQAKGGSIYVAKSTADRVRDRFPFDPIGRVALKNLSEEVEIFQLKS